MRYIQCGHLKTEHPYKIYIYRIFAILEHNNNNNIIYFSINQSIYRSCYIDRRRINAISCDKGKIMKRKNC